MPTHRRFEEHLDGLRTAVDAFARCAHRAGLDVEVPTCPDWTVRRLIGHQGAVHRWATANLQGHDLDWAPTEKAGRRSADPVEWLRDGAVGFVQALVGADDDAGTTFLHDAPAPRLFWARRQCHETTMHAVDALAASLGQMPTPDEASEALGLTTDLALDGIDELLMGFIPRSRSRLRSPEPITLVVDVDDAPVAFSVRVSADPPVTTRFDDGLPAGLVPDRVATADAVHLYLALWHRTLLESALWPLWHDTGVL